MKRLLSTGLPFLLVLGACDAASPSDMVGSTAAALGVLSTPAASLIHSFTMASGAQGFVREVCDQPVDAAHVHCHALAQSDVHGNVTQASTPAGLGVSDLRSVYSIPSAGGAGKIVAIVDAYDNPNAEADLATYRAQYGLQPCTTSNGCFRKVNQSGSSSPMPAGDAGWGIEINLDVQMVSAACPDCSIVLVEANSSSFGDLEAAEQTAIAQGATFVSNSWGGGEWSGMQNSDAAEFQHPGVSIFASTGDSGFTGGVEYPSTSSYVTAVGGTRLTQASNTARGWSESAWSGATSGCSGYIPKPSWQHDTGCANRMVADVSAVGDPGSGVAMYDSYGNGGWLVMGGTSVASPLVAGIYAVTGKRGVQPDFAYETKSAWSDVTSGSSGSCGNYFCNGEIGYDGPTGIGTPIGTALEHAKFSTLGVFRAAGATYNQTTQGEWLLRNDDSFGNPDATFLYGAPGDIPVVGDWDGNGSVTVGVFRPANTKFNTTTSGEWLVRNSNTPGNPDITLYYGAPGDLPVVGDWDGNGSTTIGVYRPANTPFNGTSGGEWLLRNLNSNGNPDVTFYYGAPGDTPVVGDWDGNGTTTIGVFRAANSPFNATTQTQWFLRNTNAFGNPDLSFSYGAPGDLPIVGGWSGTGTTTIGVFRGAKTPFNGSTSDLWLLRNTNDTGTPSTSVLYGAPGDMPVAGSWL